MYLIVFKHYCDTIVTKHTCAKNFGSIVFIDTIDTPLMSH